MQKYLKSSNDNNEKGWEHLQQGVEKKVDIPSNPIVVCVCDKEDFVVLLWVFENG